MQIIHLNEKNSFWRHTLFVLIYDESVQAPVLFTTLRSHSNYLCAPNEI